MQASVGGFNWRRALSVVGIIAIAIVVLWIASHIPRTITIFVIGGFIASAAHPIVRILERRRIARPLAIAIVYLLLVVVVGLCAFLIVPLTFAQTQILVANLPQYLQSVQVWLLHVQADVAQRFPGVTLPSQLLDVRQMGSDRVAALFNASFASVASLAINVATGAFITVSALILSVFFLLNHRQIGEAFAGLFPARKHDTARMLATEIVQIFGGYIAGQVVVSAITGIVIAGLTAIFGFKFALFLGLISAIGYAIPIVGMIAVQVIALIIAAPQGLGMILSVEIILTVIPRFSDNILVPKVMGTSVGVSPIGVMFAVFAGGELFGLPGLILGIPAAALAKLLWRYFVMPWLHGQIEIVDANQPLPEGNDTLG
ncbi:MAG: AI-2E family transporter [Candidatus Eremiobacteraeota bacterium]|nr:AI-2E family transporter [Candidatus Eremiobacteraeota bacterium]